MTMKIPALLLWFLLIPIPAALAQTVHFVTEEYAPFNHSEGGRIIGASVEQVEAIAHAAGISYTLEIMPWARAVALAEHQPMHCVFTAAQTRDRHGRFQWVQPLLKDRMVLLKRRGNPIAVRTIGEAVKLRIGAQRDDYSVDLLRERGFTDIDLATDIDITLGKLLSGRIDLMPTSTTTYEALMQAKHPVEPAILMDGQTYGLACHKGMPQDFVHRLQAALDRLILSGDQDRIFAAHGLSLARFAAVEKEK